jgi:hypothetical protein
MGLDASLSKVKRKDFYNYNRNDFWFIEYELKTEKLIVWRKQYEIHRWFYENTKIIEDYSDEVTPEKLTKLHLYLKSINDLENAEKVDNLLREVDFKKYVIYYYGAN